MCCGGPVGVIASERSVARRLTMVRPTLGRNDGRTVKLPPKTVDPYYQSRGHRDWAEKVYIRAGYKCEDCGRSKADGVRLYADHVKELKDGGDLDNPLNGRALCGACHSRKTYIERARRALTDWKGT